MEIAYVPWNTIFVDFQNVSLQVATPKDGLGYFPINIPFDCSDKQKLHGAGPGRLYNGRHARDCPGNWRRRSLLHLDPGYGAGRPPTWTSSSAPSHHYKPTSLQYWCHPIQSKNDEWSSVHVWHASLLDILLPTSALPDLVRHLDICSWLRRNSRRLGRTCTRGEDLHRT